MEGKLLKPKYDFVFHALFNQENELNIIILVMEILFAAFSGVIRTIMQKKILMHNVVEA